VRVPLDWLREYVPVAAPAAEIAARLHVGVETVRTHARNIYRKLGVSSRKDLVAAPVLRVR
jgi:hypothetical protein